MTSIPTYIVNLKKRSDRREYIKNEFRNHPQFDVHLIDAISNEIPAVGLYKSFLKIIEIAVAENYPFVLFCEDDHQFTNEFKFKYFEKLLSKIKNGSTDVLLGGVSSFECGVKVSDDLFWIDRFTGTQFVVIFSGFYLKLLGASFSDHDIIDHWMASLTDSIFLTIPMISTQRDFGYSDVTEKNNSKGRVEDLFNDTISRLSSLNKIYQHVENCQRTNRSEIMDSQFNFNLTTYIIRNDSLKKKNIIDKQFLNKPEFETKYIVINNQKDRLSGFYESLKTIIEESIANDDEIILICTDDHIFCNNYDRENLIDSIFQGAYLGADIILGGVSDTRQIIVVNKNLCWVDTFSGIQFFLVYSKFFAKIINELNKLEESGREPDPSAFFTGITLNKYVMHPFISYQETNFFGDSIFPFDLSDVNWETRFDDCSARFKRVRDSVKL